MSLREACHRAITAKRADLALLGDPDAGARLAIPASYRISLHSAKPGDAKGGLDGAIQRWRSAFARLRSSPQTLALAEPRRRLI